MSNNVAVGSFRVPTTKCASVRRRFFYESQAEQPRTFKVKSEPTVARTKVHNEPNSAEMIMYFS